MGKLIDADKLLENQYRIDDSATLSTRDVVNVEDIEDAPTVEAIPKECIEQILSMISNLAHYESPDGQELVMVSDVMRLIKLTTDPLAQSLVNFCRKTVGEYEKEHTDGNDD